MIFQLLPTLTRGQHIVTHQAHFEAKQSLCSQYPVRSLFLHGVSTLIILLNVCGTRLASAQTDSHHAVRPFVRYSAVYDDNVLGLPSQVAARDVIGLDSKSDVSHTLEVGVFVDKKFGRQSFTGNLKASKTKYNTYKFLDFDARDVSGNLNWFLGKHVEGNIGLSYARGLTPFTDFHQPLKNIRTQKREYLDGAWHFHPSWRARSGVSKSHLDYELLTQKFLNRVENRSELGLDYVARSGSTIGLLATHTGGSYPNQTQLGSAAPTGSYQQNEVKANIDWRVSGKTRLQLLAGHVSRTNEDVQLRDFNGFNARLTGEWLATGKLGLTGALWRETGIAEDLSAVYSVNKGASLAPRWQLSDKVLVEMQIKYEKRDFSQSLAATSTVSGVQQDALRSASIILLYKPLRGLTVQTSVFHTDKSSDLLSDTYRRNGLSINLQHEL
jgi:exopolysaccharide biosynthesis operon protein EpsL